jgi:hypothetical protein
VDAVGIFVVLFILAFVLVYVIAAGLAGISAMIVAILFVGVPMVFLVVSSVIVYRRRPWRLMEFMFVLVLGTMPGGMTLKYLTDRGFHIGDEIAVGIYVGVITIASFAIILAGSINGLWYVDRLMVQATGPRLLLIVMGILTPIAFLVGVFSLFAAPIQWQSNNNVGAALIHAMLLPPCAAVLFARVWVRRKLGLPMFDGQ